MTCAPRHDRTRRSRLSPGATAACVAACIVALCALSACGGGGSSSAIAPTPAPAPTPSVSPLQPPAPPAVEPDDARGAMPGLNGVRARISIPAGWDASVCLNLDVFNRHPSAPLQRWEAVVDLGVWTLRSTPGARAEGTTGFITVRSDALAPAVAAGTQTQAQLCLQPRSTWDRTPTLVSVGSDLPAASADPLEAGLWRLVSASSRLTASWQASGRFAMRPYSGHPDQQWRLRAQANGSYRFALASRDQCLGAASPAVPLVACNAAAPGWTLETLRARSDAAPGRFRLHRSDGDSECLRLNESEAATLGACDAQSDLYLEPVGYGERVAPVEFELRGRLLIKPSTDVASPRMIGRIPADTQAAVQLAYRDHLPVWFQRATDGRVRWVGDSVIASPMTSAVVEGGNALPSAATMPADVAAFLPLGRYDTAAVFYISGVDAAGAPVAGGWGWGPGASAASNGTLWVTVNGGATPAAAWVSWQNEPIEVFVHEPMHGLDSYFDRLGVPLPEGYLHGGEQNLYANNQHGWLPWYRDILLGRVIAADGSYRGYGPRAFQLGPPRLRVAAP
ncbi:hypothetical protein [Roseateles sp. BYS87W]|uniref:Ricin B lectin domain-containing protein n=1 Tax=Pelomonas baiyunensis TaxID=3299026 RepID=A0ABW7H3D2_9BURK